VRHPQWVIFQRKHQKTWGRQSQRAGKNQKERNPKANVFNLGKPKTQIEFTKNGGGPRRPRHPGTMGIVKPVKGKVKKEPSYEHMGV